MLIPDNYATQIMLRLKQGYEVANLKRFIFYLKETHTRAVFAWNTLLTDQAPDAIVQKLEGPGSVAIEREAYHRIGGMDDSFVGRGGEDNEFWEHAQTCKVWPYGCLPIIHLWHFSQPEKYSPEAQGNALFYSLSQVPTGLRIKTLRDRRQGLIGGPFGHA